MRVAGIWRYPVKSMQGEPLRDATCDADGLRGDRLWGVRDEATGRILTGRREPQLLYASAAVGDDGEPDIVLPTGERCRGAGPDTDIALSDWLGHPVRLVGAAGAPGGEAESFADATDDASPLQAWTMPVGRFVDALPLLLVTTASLRAGAGLHPEGVWDARRFRPNVLIDVDGDGWVEDAWCGRKVGIGTATLAPLLPCERCTMITRPQPALERDLEVYKSLARHHGGQFGVWTAIDAAGTIGIGDDVLVES
jgi:uncharacterized protein YcbX